MRAKTSVLTYNALMFYFISRLLHVYCPDSVLLEKKKNNNLVRNPCSLSFLRVRLPSAGHDLKCAFSARRRPCQQGLGCVFALRHGGGLSAQRSGCSPCLVCHWHKQLKERGEEKMKKRGPPTAHSSVFHKMVQNLSHILIPACTGKQDFTCFLRGVQPKSCFYIFNSYN